MTSKKIVVFGSGAVGKSAMTIQLTDGFFVTDYDPTIEETYKITLEYEKTFYQIDISDTAGMDDFIQLRTSYCRSGNGFLLVYAINHRQTFEEINKFYYDICRTKGTKNVPIVLCGNKCDLEEEYREVSKVEGEELAKSMNCPFFETSAKENINIRLSFNTVLKEIIEKNQIKTSNLQNVKPPKKSFCLLF